MAEQKKKKNPLLERFKRDMNTKEDLAKLQNKAKLESLASSGNKKLSEPAKKQLQINKAKDEDERASAAMSRSRQTVEALSNRATLKNYGGYSGPAETETKVDNPAKPKPKPKPQVAASAPKPKPKPQPTASKPKPKPAEVQPTNKRVTSAKSTLFIGPEASKAQSKFTPKSKPPKPKSSDFPPTAKGTEQFAAALRAWNKKYG